MLALHLLNSIKHGGGENVAFNYAKILKEIHVESIFIGMPDSKEYEQMISSVGNVQYKFSANVFNSADFIFVHSNINLLRLILYRLLPLSWKNKKIIYIQHLEYPRWKFVLLSILINLLCTDFVQITPLTQQLITRYIKINSHFITNFYLNKYSHKEWKSIREKVRTQLGINEDKRVITFSSVFKLGKNVGEFVKLADEMKDCPNLIFLLIGDGEEAYFVKNYKGENLKWIGFVNDVEKYLIASDVYVFLSKKEMMPMSLIEAINTEKDIICYKTIVDDFLMQGCTFNSIDKSILLNAVLPSGKDLPHYGKDYAMEKLSILLFG